MPPPHDADAIPEPNGAPDALGIADNAMNDQEDECPPTEAIDFCDEM